jgi:hypothetical protein
VATDSGPPGIPDAHVDLDIDRPLAPDRRRDRVVDDRGHVTGLPGAQSLCGDQFVGGKIGRILAERVGEHDVVLVQIGDIHRRRPAIDHDDGAAFDIGAGDGIDHAQRSDAVGNRHRAKSLAARIAVGGIAGFQIAGRDDGLDAVVGCGIEQGRAIGGRHAEQPVDMLFAEPFQNVIGNGESHASAPDNR